MATAPRSHAPAATKQRPRAPLAAMAAADVARDWGVPGLAVGTIAILILLSTMEVIGGAGALAGTIAAALVLILYIGERPLVTETRPAGQRLLGAAAAVVWFIACYVPFHVCL